MRGGRFRFEDCINLDSRPEFVAAARAFVRSRLEACEVADVTDTSVVVASELVTNAVLHARTGIELRIRCGQGVVRLEVFDENPRVPVVSPTPPGATSGRGLALVSSLATSWGIGSRERGKVIWAELGSSDGDGDEPCLGLGGSETVEDAIGEIRRTSPDS